MTAIRNGLYNVLVDIRRDAAEMTSDVKTGVLWLADGTSHCLYDLVNIEKRGLTSTLKFTLTAFKLASLSYGTLFNGVSNDLGVLQGLYLSRNFLDTNVELFRFRELTPSKVLFGVVSYVSLYQFLKKTGVLSTNEASSFSHEIGSFKVSNLLIFSRPKEVCILIISLLDIYSSLPAIKGSSLGRFASDLYQSADLLYLLKLASNVGRISGLMLTFTQFGKYTKQEKILGMMSCSASLVRYLLVCAQEREARIYAPGFTASSRIL
jgi:hypothetical protein